MKKISTLLSLLFTSALSFGQAITLDSSNVPIPVSTFNVDEITTTTPAIPSKGDNQTWDYSMNFGNTPLTNNYPVETDTFFTNHGVDVNFYGTKSLNATFGYYVTSEFDFNVNGIYESGVNIDLQSYSLSAITSNNADSMIFPAQKYHINTPKTLVKFPATNNSSWHSVSDRNSNFLLTVTMYGLNQAPGQHRYTYVRNDSIVGWGKVRVYTSSGASIPYDVLMDQIEQYAVDSFYLNGAPANVLLLNAFSVTQGQHSDVQYSYNFYRAGSFNYLMRFNYGDDSTYTTLSGAYVNTDNITSVNNVNNVTYSSLVFPNPSNGNEINVKISGQTFSLNEFDIMDLVGNTVQHGKIENQNGGMVHVSLNNNLANGEYFIRIKDNMNKEVVKEKINIQR